MIEEPNIPALQSDDPFAEPPTPEDRVMVAGKWSPLGAALESLFQGKRTKQLRTEGEEAMGRPSPEEEAAVSQAFDEMAREAEQEFGQPGQVSVVPSHIQDMAQRVYEPGRTTTRNLNFDYMESTDAAKSFVNALSEESGGFMEQRRGMRGHETTREASVSPKVMGEVRDLIGGPPGTSWNAEQLLAGREMVLRLAEDITDLSETINRTGGTVEEQARLVQLTQSIQAVQRAVQGGVAEAGRALNSMRIVASSAYQRERFKQLDDIVRTAGGQKNVRDMAAAYAQAQDPSQVAQFSRSLQEGARKGLQTVQEIWINSILSGVQTHVINVMGNTIAQVYETGVIKPLASGIGTVRRGLQKAAGKEATKRAYLAEIPAEVVGKTQGILDTFHAMYKERGNYLSSLDAEQKLENPKYRAISAQNYGMDPSGAAGKVVDATGAVIRTPGTLLGVGDDMFKSMVYRGEINAQATRQALSEGLEGEALHGRVYQLMQDPTPDMHAAARAEAEKLTFTASLEGEGSGFLSWFGRVIQEGNEKFPMMRFFTPFVRTPTNLMRYMLDNSVMAPLTKSWREEWNAGGIRRDAAMARYGAALAGTYAVISYTESGVITGKGPQDWRLRQQLERTGWKPNAILVNGTYYSYDRGDPIGGMIGFIADAADMIRYSEDDATSANIAAAAFGGVLQNFSNKTYVSGFSDMVGMLAGGDDINRMIERWVKRTATGLIPFSSLLRTFRKGADEVVRETRNRNDFIQSLVNSYANTVPGFSDALPAKLDWKGEILTMEPWMPWRSMSPIRYSALKGDMPSQELVDNGVTVYEPSYLLNIQFGDGERMNLLNIDPSGELYNRYKEFVGKARYEEVKLAIADLNQDEETRFSGVDTLRAQELQKAVADGRKYGENEFLDWYEQNAFEYPGWPELEEDVVSQYREMNAALVQRGKPQEGPFRFTNIGQSGLIPEGVKETLPGEMPEF